MPAVLSTTTKREGFVGHYLKCFANKFFSNHAKRLIFISSLAGLAYPCNESDSKTAAKINKIFHLVNKPEALEFPVYVKSIIWKDCDLSVLSSTGVVVNPSSASYLNISEEDTNLLAKQVLAQTPDWLKYSTYEDMFADVKRLFFSVKEYRMGDMAAA